MSTLTGLNAERRARHLAYMEGWRDGAGLRAMSIKYRGTSYECDYSDGFTCGCKARNGASAEATERYDYSPDQVYCADLGDLAIGHAMQCQAITHIGGKCNCGAELRRAGVR